MLLYASDFFFWNDLFNCNFLLAECNSKMNTKIIELDPSCHLDLGVTRACLNV